MKTFLFSLIFVLLSCSLWAQQQTDVLQQMEHRMHNDPLIQQQANPDQGRMISDEMDFLIPDLKNSDLDIRIDSIYSWNNYGEEFRQYETFNNSGQRLTHLCNRFKNGELNDKWYDANSYDANGNKLTNLSQTWDYGLESFYSSICNFIYDNNNNILSALSQRYSDGVWVNDISQTYTYDEEGNLTTDIRLDWENGAWVNTWFHNLTYDVDDNLIVYLIKEGDNNTWINDKLVTFTYNDYGSIISKIYHTWQGVMWTNEKSYTYTYDNNGNILTELYQLWDDDEWLNDWQVTNTYDQNSNVLTFLRQEWKNCEWIGTHRYVYTYNINGNILTRLVQQKENNVLVNDYFMTFTYDCYGRMLTSYRQTWENDDWMNSSFWTYNFNEKGDLLSSNYQQWENDAWEDLQIHEFEFLPGKIIATSHFKDSSGEWICSSPVGPLQIILEGEIFSPGYGGCTHDFYYTDFSGIEDPQTNSENSPILCYPNPVTDQINIEIDPTWQAKNYRLELFSQTGQKVKSFEISSDIGSSIIPIKVDDVPPGLYLLRIEAGKQIFSQKIIISK